MSKMFTSRPQNEEEIEARVIEMVQAGQISPCNCTNECKCSPLWVNAPLQDFIQTEKDESEGKSERNKR
jgi:hypothetical protein